MPIINHVIKYDPPETFRAASIRGIFDFTAGRVERSWSVEVPGLSEPWSVGVIVGPSGSGKSQIACKAFGEKAVNNAPVWGKGPIVDSFPALMEPQEICDLLSRVGLGSVPAWLLPYVALSTGQKFRADMARRFAEHKNKLVVVDEFSSVVDRIVAKTTSAVIAKHIRKSDIRFVAVTCHYDVIEWLCPDWILDMATGTLARGCLQRRPPMQFRVFECGAEAWGFFKVHHYLSANLSNKARCFVATIDGALAAFLAVIKYPHVQFGLVNRVHRVVTLPDYQGMGIALRLMREIAMADDRHWYISTTHGPFAHSLARSGDWRCCRLPGFCSKPSGSSMVKKGHRNNVLSAGFKFVRPVPARDTDAPCMVSDGKAEMNRSPSTGDRK